MRRNGCEPDDIVLVRLGNGDDLCSGSTAVVIGHFKGIIALRQTAHSDSVSHLFHLDGIPIILPVLHGLDAIGRFASINVYHSVAGTGLMANGGVVPALADGGGELRKQTYPYGLGGVKPIVASVVIIGCIREELHVLLPIPLAFVISCSPSGARLARGCP